MQPSALGLSAVAAFIPVLVKSIPLAQVAAAAAVI